jgi:hypothetical protein
VSGRSDVLNYQQRIELDFTASATDHRGWTSWSCS